jgi:peptidoglycan/xylan/chitin deacetylase (PgdA/CDA1 family)
VEIDATQVATGAVAAIGAAAYAVRGRSSMIFAPSVYHGDRSRPALSLTFDDGPSESTPALLDLLSKHNVTAIFFMCGTNVRRYPSIARQVAAAGHEIGNHTDSHPYFFRCSSAEILREIADAQQSIQDATGITPRLFRAPYGVRWFGLRAAQRKFNLLGVMWTVIARDWVLPGPEAAARLIDRSANGGILCLHDGRALDPHPDIRATLDAVERAVPVLRQHGFRFETVSEILCPTT